MTTKNLLVVDHAADEEPSGLFIARPLLAIKASWLLSNYGDASWQVKDGKDGTVSIHFDWLLPDPKEVAVRWVTLGAATAPNSRMASGATLSAWSRVSEGLF
jgi:hypothetical protein